MPGARNDLKAALDKTAAELGVTLPPQVREIIAANTERHMRELVSSYRERTRRLHRKDVEQVTSSLSPAPRKKSCAWLPNWPDLSNYRMRMIVITKGEQEPGPQPQP